MESSAQQIAADVTERCRTLINNDLKKILKEEGLAQTGVKAVLQSRVIAIIRTALANNDVDTLRRLQYRVGHNGNAPPSLPPSYSHQPPPTVNGHSTMTNGYQQNGHAQFAQPGQAQHRQQDRKHFFKDSPFFEIRASVLNDLALEASPSHRNTATRSLILNDAICARMKEDKSLRLLLFSAIEQPLAPFTRIDITFPSQIEVRVNGNEVKANYKGLKGKPGSTRPADITDFVHRITANYRNSLTVTYALTHKKFNLFVYLARTFSVDALTKKIKERNVITKQSVLDEMLKKASDPDIEVGSSVMSLKDPISTLRINTPCRSTLCTHYQCFDGASFLQLQEQAPTWLCPICNKSISYEGLAVDEYVAEILSKARNSDQITIQPDGQWSAESDASPSKRNGNDAHNNDFSDDEIMEIPDFRLSAIKTEVASTPVSLNTPPAPSRETSSAPRSGHKRTSEVVDLTLSDDDEPSRPTKKVAYNIHNTPNSLPDPSRQPFKLPPLGNSNPTIHSRPYPGPSRGSFGSSIRPEPYPTSFTPTPPPPPPMSYSNYRSAEQPSRSSYPGSGTPSYPAYLGSSP